MTPDDLRSAAERLFNAPHGCSIAGYGASPRRIEDERLVSAAMLQVLAERRKDDGEAVTTLPSRARAIVEKMEPWFRDINKKPRKKNTRDGRTEAERLFDSGVFAASELVRRLTGDEKLSIAIHEMCIWRQRQHQAEHKHD